MAYSFNGTNQTLTASFSGIASWPLTIAILALPNNNIAAHDLFAITSGGPGSLNGFYLIADGTTGGKPNSMYSGAASLASANTSTSFAASVWQSFVGTVSSATSRAAFLDGGGKGTNATNITPNAPSTIGIGNLFGFASQFTNGRLAEAALWSAVLTDDEIQSLARGFKPRRVRPQSLAFYAPLIREVRDWRAGVALTNNGGATVADHPRVY